MRLTISTLLSFYFAIVSSGPTAIDPRLNRALPEGSCSPGLYCDSCSTISVCIGNGDSTTSVQIGTCPAADKFCLDGRCVDKAENPGCGAAQAIQFKCTRIGMFPDAYNCKKFHMCTRDSNGIFTHWNEDCPNPSYGYHAGTTLCSRKLTNNNCPAAPPVPLCRRVGDAGAVPDNPHLYYICLFVDGLLYPQLYVCENGKVYNGNFGCDEPK